MRRRLGAAGWLAAVALLARPGARVRARPRRQAGPADPALAVRVGGGGRARRLVRRARRAVAQAAPGGRGRAALSARAARPGGRSAARSASPSSRSSSTRASPGCRLGDGQPRCRRSFYVIFWVGVPFASLLFGDVFAAVQPVARGRARRGWAFGRAARRGAGADAPTRRGSAAGPPRSGSSPSPGSSSSTPTATTRALLAALALVYAAIQLVGMSLYGIEAVESQRATRSASTSASSRASAPLHWAPARAAGCARRWRRDDARPRRRHRRAAVHDDRHDDLRRLLAGRDLDGAGGHRAGAAAALPQPRLLGGDGAGDHVHDRPARHGRARHRPVPPRRARHALGRPPRTSAARLARASRTR